MLEVSESTARLSATALSYYNRSEYVRLTDTHPLVAVCSDKLADILGNTNVILEFSTKEPFSMIGEPASCDKSYGVRLVDAPAFCGCSFRYKNSIEAVMFAINSISDGSMLLDASSRLNRDYGVTKVDVLVSSIMLHDIKCIADALSVLVSFDGSTFNTLEDMCSHYGVPVDIYNRRVERGFTERSALSVTVTAGFAAGIESVDHTGEVFSTRVAMCSKWGTTPKKVDSLLNYGLTLKDALECQDSSILDGVWHDHTGAEFDSFNSMCRNWQTGVREAFRKLTMGFSLEDVLTTGLEDSLNQAKDNEAKAEEHVKERERVKKAKLGEKEKNKLSSSQSRLRNKVMERKKLRDAELAKQYGKPCRDFNGLYFNSHYDMCEYWGISFSMYRSRLSRGYSLESTLTTPENMGDRYNGEHVDHKGCVYRSSSEMCKQWGIPISVFNRRLDLGESVEHALWYPVGDAPCDAYGNKACADHMGQIFDSFALMCKQWGTTPVVCRRRLSTGLTMEDALTKPADTE